MLSHWINTCCDVVTLNQHNNLSGWRELQLWVCAGCAALMMMMIAFITFNSIVVLLIEGLCSSNPWEVEFSGFRWNRTDDLGQSLALTK